uniref:LAGLIDADG endonuclease n=1 Tax=Powellomyces hirtus TaxID=109895 RepID=A0A4P8NQ36_9FUNG|nr:LAGLIDADG endonuclease [Powellomyces hirtus]
MSSKVFNILGQITLSDSKGSKYKGKNVGGSLSILSNAPKWLGPYLAGLIEGDGSIIVPGIDDMSRVPCIRICFALKDLPLATKLRDMLGYGRIVFPKTGEYVLWEITDMEGFYVVATLVNGYFRTPKLEALHRLVDWINARSLVYLNKKGYIDFEFISLDKLGLDLSPILGNSWLAGFSDADSNFNVIISQRSNKNSIRVQTQFRIELRQTYHRKDMVGTYGTIYFDIMSIIANVLGVNVYNRARLLGESMTYQYYFVAGTVRARNTVRYYFTSFPLLSSKRLDFLDWCKIADLSKDIPLTASTISSCNKIKAGMNKGRTVFNWDHLSNL